MKARTQLVAVVGLLVVIAGGLGIYWRSRPGITLTAADCAIVHPDGVCELLGTGTLRLLVDAPPGATILVLQDGRELPVQVQAVDQGQLVEIKARPGARSLTVLAHRGVGDLRHATMPIRQWQAPGWMQDARKEWEDDRQADAIVVLERHIDGPISDVERAQARGMLGRIRREQGLFTESERLLRQALVEDRKAGLMAPEIRDVMALAGLLAEQLHRMDEAEALLRSRDALIERAPGLRAWRELHLANYRWLRGDFAEALPHIEEGLVWARRFADRAAVAELQLLLAHVLQSLGRAREAELELSGLHEIELPPCRQAEVLTGIGRWRLELLMQQPPVIAAAMMRRYEPRPVLRAALALRRAECKQQRQIANDLTALVEAEILVGQYDEAEGWLRQTEGLLKEGDRWLELEWADLRGQIALGRGRFPEAKAIYRDLIARVGRDSLALAQAGPVRANDWYETRWRAWVGLARALGPTDPDSAIEAYRQAEVYLDERSKEMPLGAGRGGFLGRHERATALFIDLLVRRGRLDEALRVMRHARVRGLLAFANLVRSLGWSDGERLEWAARVAEQRRLRQELDRIAVEERGAPQAEEQRLARRRTELERMLTTSMQSVLDRYDWTDSARALRAPAEDEVMLACHPGRVGWWCLAARGKEILPIEVAHLDEGTLRAALDTAKIASPKGMLHGARRLSVLGYGEMRLLDLDRMQVGGQPLGQRLAIVYPLDLPAAVHAIPAATEGEDRKALLLFDPLSDFGRESRAAASGVRGLLDAMWSVGDARIASGLGDDTAGARRRREELQVEIAAAALFHYYGHGDFRPDGGWRHRMRIDRMAGLMLGDIITLARAPERVVLAGCNTGLSTEETGGLEGLGLAQAFLLRGSRWVIGSVRKVDMEVAAVLSVELYRAGLDRPDGDPVMALQKAREAVRARMASAKQPGSAEVERSLAAFRVFVM